MSAPQSFLGGKVTLHPGDCLEVVKRLADNSVDAVVCDPPYALVSIARRFGADGAAPCRASKNPGATGAYQRASAGFMGKTWDTGETAFAVAFWAEVFRVLKPGGHVVAFGGTRSYHRLACAIEDAGFEIRDQIRFDHESGGEAEAFLTSLNAEQRAQFAKLCEADALGQLAWTYGSGFLKSHSVSKAIDKAAGAARRVLAASAPVKRMIPGADQHREGGEKTNGREFVPAVTEAATEPAKRWEGWGSALKPAWEPICLARKPLSEKTVAANVLRWGTGALNIDACRIEGEGNKTFLRDAGDRDRDHYRTGTTIGSAIPSSGRRWPANICHDGSDEVVAAFPETKSGVLSAHHQRRQAKKVNTYGDWADGPGRTFENAPTFGDSGSAARFFYSAKAGDDDRLGSKHPTIKPVDLMRWLVRLVTPPGGTVLDPFAGTGTTGEAAWREGFSAVLIEREAEYQADIGRRMALAVEPPRVRAQSRIEARGSVAGAGPLFAALDPSTGGRTVYRAFRRDRSGRSVGPIGMKR